LLAIDLQIEDMNNQGVAGFRTVSGLSPLTSAKVSPGFCSPLPKQSREFASRMLPGLSRATGGAAPKRYFTVSMVA